MATSDARKGGGCGAKEALRDGAMSGFEGVRYIDYSGADGGWVFQHLFGRTCKRPHATAGLHGTIQRSVCEHSIYERMDV